MLSQREPLIIPFTDKGSCLDEADIQEAMFRAVLAEGK
jgi:hypothetical protein